MRAELPIIRAKSLYILPGHILSQKHTHEYANCYFLSTYSRRNVLFVFASHEYVNLFFDESANSLALLLLLQGFCFVKLLTSHLVSIFAAVYFGNEARWW